MGGEIDMLLKKSILGSIKEVSACTVTVTIFPINATIDGASYLVPAASKLNSGEANIDIEMA